MLKFDKVRLSSFKSFVDNVELQIELGLTGVVGPNGCGKSNLVEALRWGMGETSAKQMRGTGMEDVIFGGSASRPSRNIAEVIITLDNSDRTAPAQFNGMDELQVSRRIERDKGSSYRINGTDVRARDVQLLFADAATGARSTALVSQGRIGTIISAKPKDRRGLLEEAAGITGLHSRRHEAELRLGGAETNLERLDDILSTLQTQLAGIKKQVRQATRYRNISGHIRKAEATMFYILWEQSNTKLVGAKNKLKTADSVVSEKTSLAAQATNFQAKSAEVVPELRKKEGEAAAALQRITVDRENLEFEENRIKTEIEETAVRLTQIQADTNRENAITLDAAEAIGRLSAENERILSSIKDGGALHETVSGNLRKANLTVEQLEASITLLTEQVAHIEAQRNSSTKRIKELKQHQSRLLNRISEVSKHKHELEENNPDSAKLTSAQAALTHEQNNLMSCRNSLLKAEKARTDAESNSHSATKAVHKAQAAVTELQAEERALEKILASKNNDLFPAVIDALEVEAGYEVALGSALGDDLTSPTDEAALVHWRTLPDMLNAPALPVGAKPLSSVVLAPPALKRRLHQIGVTESDDEAAILATDLQQGQRLVSRKGGLWRWDGFTVSPEASTPTTTSLEQRSRLKELRVQLTERQLELDTTEAALRKQKKTEQVLRDTELVARASLEKSEKTIDLARESLLEAKENINAHSSQLKAIVEAEKTTNTDLNEVNSLLAIAEGEYSDFPEPLEEREKIGHLRKKLEGHRKTQIELRTQFEGLEHSAKQRDKRLEAINLEVDSWNRRKSESNHQLKELKLRKHQLNEDLTKLKAAPNEINQRLQSLLDSLSTLENRRTKAANELRSAENVLRNAEKQSRVAENSLNQAREDRVRAEGGVEQASQICTSILERLKDRLSCTPEALFELSGLNSDKELPDLEVTERKVERLHRERETMGAVNLRAEQEASELQEQITTLDSERDDLLAAIDKLRKGISELNREGRARLLSSFKNVDKHFQELFIRLFGGGHAHLALTESEDPLDAGLEIMASPPGKKLQGLSLLSGGEQALTALSLLFAVFLTNPAPICVLDEVDAPLDDANVDRFCTLLEQMSASEQTRFLIITHHRMTMARMDRLFGVTMAERGVSQLVSVDLQHAEKLRETA
ncbi:MAG: chromosome segregation protein SMC [Magnetovibrio sp.]|nr:chromosome segregation protein SMC [Magnetovibrio sp.]